jgi:hypothetical protein
MKIDPKRDLKFPLTNMMDQKDSVECSMYGWVPQKEELEKKLSKKFTKRESYEINDNIYTDNHNRRITLRTKPNSHPTLLHRGKPDPNKTRYSISCKISASEILSSGDVNQFLKDIGYNKVKGITVDSILYDDGKWFVDIQKITRIITRCQGESKGSNESLETEKTLPLASSHEFGIGSMEKDGVSTTNSSYIHDPIIKESENEDVWVSKSPEYSGYLVHVYTLSKSTNEGEETLRQIVEYLKDCVEVRKPPLSWLDAL